jgi:hypothetical protein
VPVDITFGNACPRYTTKQTTKFSSTSWQQQNGSSVMHVTFELVKEDADHSIPNNTYHLEYIHSSHSPISLNNPNQSIMLVTQDHSQIIHMTINLHNNKTLRPLANSKAGRQPPVFSSKSILEDVAQGAIGGSGDSDNICCCLPQKASLYVVVICDRPQRILAKKSISNQQAGVLQIMNCNNIILPLLSGDRLKIVIWGRILKDVMNLPAAEVAGSNTNDDYDAQDPYT